MAAEQRFSIVIVGGGTGGITVAARLRRAGITPGEIALLEPSDRHYYQPLWTLVGGGVVQKEATVRPEAQLIPRGVIWLQEAASQLQPEHNAIITSSGAKITYEWLVLAAGISMHWEKIAGLPEALGCGGVCSNYHYQYVSYTWDTIRNFQGGNALFTQPSGPIRCGGAPQKIMYLAEDYFRWHGVRDRARVIFISAGKQIFGVEKYRKTLEKIIATRGIECLFRHELVAVRPDTSEAVIVNLDTRQERILPYAMLHVTPPMSAPDFVANSPLADPNGWLDVDKYTLRHVRYENVFGIGDCINVPTGKTGAAIRKQAPVLVKNLLAARSGQPLTARYNGYSSCPLITGYGRVVLAEFDYDHEPVETFPFDQSKPRYSMWLLKRYVLPLLYWYGMLKGRA